MPYITTERVKEIRQELKKVFPNFKFSVTREHHSTVNVSVLSAPFNLLPDEEVKYESVNQYYISEHYKEIPQKKEVLEKIFSIMDAGNKIMFEDGDYGSIPQFYTHLSIGKWNQPFQVK